MESASEEERPIYRQLRSYSQRVFSVFGDKVPVPTVMATVITKGQVQDVKEQSCDILDMDVRPRKEEKPGKDGSHQLSLSKKSRRVKGLARCSNRRRSCRVVSSRWTPG